MKKCPVCNKYFNWEIIESHAALCCDTDWFLDDKLPVFSESDNNRKDEEPMDHVTKCVSKTLVEMSDIQNPKLVIANYVSHFFNGIKLDNLEKNDDVILFGIVVDRDNLFSDMFSEFERNEDLHYPLEVTFIGEEAADYGGPRREFLTLAVKSIKENMFKDGLLVNEETIGKERYLLNIAERKYEIAGTITGLSLLEGGPTPRLFKDFQAVQNDVDKEENKEFLKGLKRIGLQQLCKAKNQIADLFNDLNEPTEPVSYGFLVKLFKPQFSEEGSNSYSDEKKVYRHFLDYIKEVAAHRRGNIHMVDILRFVTGLEEVPLLGFHTQPSIIFVETESVLPTSSTCTCTLFLSRIVGMKEHVYNMFDYAFANNYFGKV